jgi:hypothetical protein
VQATDSLSSINPDRDVESLIVKELHAPMFIIGLATNDPTTDELAAVSKQAADRELCTCSSTKGIGCREIDPGIDKAEMLRPNPILSGVPAHTQNIQKLTAVSQVRGIEDQDHLCELVSPGCVARVVSAEWTRLLGFSGWTTLNSSPSGSAASHTLARYFPNSGRAKLAANLDRPERRSFS